jgi:hypothetical protein
MEHPEHQIARDLGRSIFAGHPCRGQSGYQPPRSRFCSTHLTLKQLGELSKTDFQGPIACPLGIGLPNLASWLADLPIELPTRGIRNTTGICQHMVDDRMNRFKQGFLIFAIF